MPNTSLKKRILPFGMLLILLTGVFFGGPLKLARAHAEYERSEPMAGSVIAEPPPEIQVWFTQELFRRKGANILEVFDSAGTQVDKKDTRIDDDDRAHVMVSLPEGLLAGIYTVHWRNLSAEDGHEGSGEFSFTVNPAAGETSPQVNPTAVQPSATEPSAPALTPAPLVTPTPAPAPTSGGLPCLGGIILAGLSLGLVVTSQGRSKGVT
ncbi:MAG: hypothetical protein Fur0044_14200 [Anaerolineae bacterium]|nr:copper resistance protein CopC [Anaerolineales bacterium]MCQ3974752.1 hypothetical protein [Anaerolineae bacterium]